MIYPEGGQPEKDWNERLAIVVETMREISRQTDPEAMVRTYAQKVRQLLPADRRLSLSRRDLSAPRVRITRSTTWEERINPWQERDRLPVLDGGLLGELIHGDEPRLIDDLQVDAGDPAAEYLAGQRSLLAIPLYDQGVALNMVVILRKEPAAFRKDQFPELVWMSNLFGRATNHLVLADQLRRANTAIDEELKIVGDIQRSLLPAQLPRIPTMDLAAFYQPSKRAGGDYYDFLPLAGNKWGILIADVSGHGAPSAVLMAITHTIAHTYPGEPIPPSRLLTYVNRQLATRYTNRSETFVTAFYGIYDPARMELTYANAGHNPPRVKRCQDGTLSVLDGIRSLPLGIQADLQYGEIRHALQKGDQIIFYTDGVTEALNPAGDLFGTNRLDEVLETCSLEASALLDSALRAVDEFAAGRPADDDRTMIVARIV